MKKIIVAVAALALGESVAWAQTGTVNYDLKPMAGNWKGTMAQRDTASSYPIKVTVFPAARPGNQVVAKVDYPTLQCGGEWRLKNTAGTAMVVDEIITYGVDNCINGQIQVSLYPDPKTGKTLMSASGYSSEYTAGIEINIKASLFRY